MHVYQYLEYFNKYFIQRLNHCKTKKIYLILRKSVKFFVYIYYSYYLPLRKPDNQGRLVFIVHGTRHDPRIHKISDIYKVYINNKNKYNVIVRTNIYFHIYFQFAFLDG